MVRHERNARFDRSIGDAGRAAGRGAAPAPVSEDPVSTPSRTPRRPPAITDPSLWDPMPVTLPTYVSKPAAARRTVRTIDLDSTGVWSSGRSESDTALAREADEADRAARARAS